MIKNKLTRFFLAFITTLSLNANGIEADLFNENKPAVIQSANAEFIYKFLLAEIATQRGDLNSAGHLSRPR